MTQEQALSVLKTGANVFLTGEPGSGKTHTVNAYVSWLRSHSIEPAITASTGIAATHIRGMTIHSWSGIGILDKLTGMDLDRIASKEHVARRIQKTRVLIIDEISMLSGGTLSMVDQVAREVRHRDEPFGGMQVVLVGDFFQLPPIARHGATVSFAFESSAWKDLHLVTCYLTDQYRQDDEKFLSLLGAIRKGEWDEEHSLILQDHHESQEEVHADTPRLFTHNVDVDRLNNEKLEALPGKAYVYRMTGQGGPMLIEGLKRGCLSPEVLTLKEGAIVMCTKNNAVAGYVNGTLGTVIGFERGTDYPLIETHDGEELTIATTDWALEENGKVRASISQLPLRLAWAITVHKSQGMSMDAAAMDLGRAFEFGQGYVALSRLRRLSGLTLLGWSEHATKVHPKVLAEDAELRAASEDAAEAFGALEEHGERETLEKNFILASGGTLEALKEGEEKPAKPSTYDETLALIEEGKSLGEIVTKRDLTFGTICDHVEKLVASGRLSKEKVEALVPAKLESSLPAIFEAIKKVGPEKLGLIHAKLKGKYTYDDLKFARVLYQADR